MKKYKIIKSRNEISVEEAAQLADFDQLVEAHLVNEIKKPNKWRIVRGILLLGSFAGLIFYSMMKDSFEVTLPESYPSFNSNEMPSVSNPGLLETTVLDEQNEDEIPPIIEESHTPEKKIPESNLEKAKKLESGSTKESSGFVEASPVDGFPALYQYFDENLVYPTEVLSDGVEGKVIVKFVIDPKGMPAKVTIEKSLHDKLDSIAVEMVLGMPPWNPARLNGNSIPSTHRIPLFFQIDQTKE